MTTNPERLRSYTNPAGTLAVPCGVDSACRSHESIYLREDLAIEQTAAALRAEAHETDALRRGRDALLSGEFVQKVAAEREVYRMALEKIVSIMVPGKVWEPWQAKETAEAALAAAKGAG